MDVAHVVAYLRQAFPSPGILFQPFRSPYRGSCMAGYPSSDAYGIGCQKDCSMLMPTALTNLTASHIGKPPAEPFLRCSRVRE